MCGLFTFVSLTTIHAAALIGTSPVYVELLASILDQFPYALSYGEFSWQPKSVRAVAKPFSPITKSQTRPIARHPNAKKSDDKAGIERSKKVILTIGITKAGLSKRGRNVIQIIGASIANQIRYRLKKTSQVQVKLRQLHQHLSRWTTWFGSKTSLRASTESGRSLLRAAR